MDVSLAHFLQQVLSNPALTVTTLLTLGVIFVNGWTDAPNAIATCVTTRCMRVRSAVIMAAIFNFLGVFIMTQLNASVASTISNMVDFGGDTNAALIALCAALFSIVVYSVGASLLGIPTSESHSLIAGLSGAAIAIQGGIGGINMGEWVKVLYGLVASLLFGFAVGWLVCKAVTLICAGMDRRRTNGFFTYAQIVRAAAMSFMHGAQDGQKFIGVLFLGMAFCNGQPSVTGVMIPVWLMILCSAIMGVGTSVGGERIIKSVGQDMVKLEKYQGFSADLSSALCLLVMTVLGIPVSTTHTKTSTIMGVGAVRRLSAINFGVVRDMMLTWVFNLPRLRSHQLRNGQTVHGRVLERNPPIMARQKDVFYFDGFRRSADYACQAAKLLSEVMHDFNPDQLRERMDSMHAIEKSADEVRHDMMDELVTAFITPFDREDIDELGHVLDDVTDSIEGVLNRMYYDNVTDMRDDAVQMSDMVVRATESICELVNELPRFRHSKTLRELVFAINTIETDADHLFIESMRTLHTTCTDPLQVFAWHDVYRHLEQCSDDCERVANTIDSIVMKNS